MLEIAAIRFSDSGFDFAGVFVDVVGWCGNGGCTRGSACGNGDHRTVAQGHGDRSAGRVGQCRGVNDGTTFGHGVGSTQAQGRGVRGIGDRGLSGFIADLQLLVIATVSLGDGGAQRAAASQGIVGCGEVDAAGGLAHRNSDGLAVGQGDHNRRTGHRSGDRCGVHHSAAFSDARGRGQADGRGIDSVGDVGDGRSWVSHQVLEVAAIRFSDSGFDLARVLVHVIGRRRHCGGAGSGAGRDGDDCTVGQRDRDRCASGIGQCRGVDDGTTFGHGVGSTQAQGRGVRGIGDRGLSGFIADLQLLVIATVSLGDGGAQRAAASQGIVGCGEVDAARGLAHRDGDGLAVGQGDHNRGAGHRSGDRRGVNHDAAFGHARGSGQADGGRVDGVSNVGDCRRWIGDQVFEVAAIRFGDSGFDFARIFVDVVGWCRNSGGARGGTGCDGDHRTVRQGYGNRCASCIGQGGGVNDGTTFGHGVGSAQAQGGGVRGIGDRGLSGFIADLQLLVIATVSLGDGGAQRAAASQGIVGCGEVDAAGGLAHRNSDGLAVGQGDHNRRTGHRSGDRCGVHHSAAFSDARGRGQADGGRVDGVSDIGHCRRRVGFQVFEVAAVSLGDGGFDFARIFVHVVSRCGDGGCTRGGARGDGDDCTVAEGHGDWRARCVAQGGGVDNGAAFSHGVGGREAQSGGVRGIGDRGLSGLVADLQLLVVTAVSLGDGGAQRAATGQGIVGRGEIDRSLAFADRNGDGLAVGQSHYHWRTGHRRGHRRGVNHGATFSHAWRSGQADRRRIDSVGDISHSRSWVGDQVFEVAAIRFGDSGFDFARIFVHVVSRCGDGGCTRGGARGDGDDCTVAEGHGDWRARCVAQGGGVDNGAAFSHGVGGREAQSGGVRGIGDRGLSGFVVDVQLFVVATVRFGDGGTQGATASQGVIRRGEIHRTLAFANWDSDGLTVGQSHHDRRASHWRGDRRGVYHDAAFSHAWSSGQADGGRVDGVGDVGDGWRRIGFQVFEIAAVSLGDGGFDLTRVLVNIIRRSGNGGGAGSGACGNGDHCTVAEGHGDWRARCVAQGGGVDNGAAFGHGVGGRQAQRRSVRSVGDSGLGRLVIDLQLFVVATLGLGDGGAQGAATGQGIVGCGEIDRSLAFADRNGDGLAIG